MANNLKNNILYIPEEVEDKLYKVFPNYWVVKEPRYTDLKEPYLLYIHLRFNNELYYKEIFFNSKILIVPMWYYQKNNYIPYGICVKNITHVLNKDELHILNTIGSVHFNKLYYIENIKNIK